MRVFDMTTDSLASHACLDGNSSRKNEPSNTAPSPPENQKHALASELAEKRSRRGWGGVVILSAEVRLVRCRKYVPVSRVTSQLTSFVPWEELRR